jgi:hypothetical protein
MLGGSSSRRRGDLDVKVRRRSRIYLASPGGAPKAFASGLADPPRPASRDPAYAEATAWQAELRRRSAFVFARGEEMAEEAAGDEKDDAGCST